MMAVPSAFDPINWFWIVGGDESRAWSSAVGDYVQAWPQESVTHVPDEAQLDVVLRHLGQVSPVASVDDVVAERGRRLSLGFDFDFGDDRGVHRIGTTPEDMAGWYEVAKASAAMIAIGIPSAEFAIVTNTGPATVTALEFQSILVAAAVAWQPIWGASFALQAMTPIPSDYRSDSYWQAGP